MNALPALFPFKNDNSIDFDINAASIISLAWHVLTPNLAFNILARTPKGAPIINCPSSLPWIEKQVLLLSLIACALFANPIGRPSEDLEPS